MNEKKILNISDKDKDSIYIIKNNLNYCYIKTRETGYDLNSNSNVNMSRQHIIKMSDLNFGVFKKVWIILIIFLLLSNFGIERTTVLSIEKDEITLTDYSGYSETGTRGDNGTVESNFTPLRSHIRTFINGGDSSEFLAQHFDIFAWGNLNAKSMNPSAINLRYEYLGWQEGTSKHQALLDYCDLNNLTSNDIEDMFLHAKEDVNYTLGEPLELDPLVTKLVPGWDPVNDLNGDYHINDSEFTVRANPNASARYKNQSRIPNYRWGPPENYQMNQGDDNFKDFFVTYYFPDVLVEGYDGLWIDTLSLIPILQGDTKVLEYPDLDQYGLDRKTILTDLVDYLPDDTIIIGNGWHEDPIIISGSEYENWVRITNTIDSVKLNTILDRDEKEIIQLIQYRPIYDEVANPNRPDLFIEGVTLERDQLFSLALYYLVHGDYTYYGYGTHGGYHLDEERWFDAIDYDIGQPLGSYYFFDGVDNETENILINGDFEIDEDEDGNPDYWEAYEPVEMVSDVKHEGNYSVMINSTTEINNYNRQWVTLEPNTTYTLSVWMKTENVTGDFGGANIYPIGFDDLQESDPWIGADGTTDWTFYSMIFTTGSDTTGRINYRIFYGAGTAWFDDIRLTKGHSNKVFARDFENATVLLKAKYVVGDNTTTAYNLNGYYRPLKANGTLEAPVNTIELMGGEGAILIREDEYIPPTPDPLYLKQGWNLISLPTIQNETDITTVLESIDGDYDAVQRYDASDDIDPWKLYKVGKPFGNDLTDINETMGFWIYITAQGGTTLIPNGSIPSISQYIPLIKGWNLVGYPSIISMLRNDALNNLNFSSQIYTIEYFNSTTGKIEKLGENDFMKPGMGYWIYARSNCVWEVPIGLS